VAAVPIVMFETFQVQLSEGEFGSGRAALLLSVEYRFEFFHIHITLNQRLDQLRDTFSVILYSAESRDKENNDRG